MKKVSSQKKGERVISPQKARFLTFVRNDKQCFHFDQMEKSLLPGTIGLPRIIEKILKKWILILSFFLICQSTFAQDCALIIGLEGTAKAEFGQQEIWSPVIGESIEPGTALVLENDCVLKILHFKQKKEIEIKGPGKFTFSFSEITGGELGPTKNLEAFPELDLGANHKLFAGAVDPSQIHTANGESEQSSDGVKSNAEEKQKAGPNTIKLESNEHSNLENDADTSDKNGGNPSGGTGKGDQIRPPSSPSSPEPSSPAPARTEWVGFPNEKLPIESPSQFKIVKNFEDLGWSLIEFTGEDLEKLVFPYYFGKNKKFVIFLGTVKSHNSVSEKIIQALTLEGQEKFEQSAGIWLKLCEEKNVDKKVALAHLDRLKAKIATKLQE